jgi:fibronectin type 3 domain-containing protein
MPVDGESSVSVDTIINAVFYEPVTGVDAASFTLGSSAGSVAGVVSLSADGLTATFSHGGLASNTEYTATLTTGVKDTWANPMASDHVWTFTTVDTVPPDAPVGLVATAISHERIDMVWGSSSDNIGVTGYRIYRDGAAIDNTVATSYSDTGGLTHNTPYCYEVTALDAAGNESPKSNQSCKNTLYLDTTAPDAPTGLVANAISPFDIELTWDAPWDDIGVVGYKIFNGTGEQRGTSSTTSFTDTGLDHITFYCYEVSAFDASGNESTKSAQACEQTLYNDVTAPDAPSALTATAASNVQINLAWSASPYDDVGIEVYRIYRNSAPVANTPDVFFYDTGLTNTTGYCYEVSALDAAGNESSKTAQACDTTLDPLGFVLQLADTRQTICYDTAGTEINCAGTGQDGEYTGTELSYTDNGDDTVTDNLTGLMWQKGVGTTITWQWGLANSYCMNLVHGTGSLADWRLPTIRQLETLMIYNTTSTDRAIDTSYFPMTVFGIYWSSTVATVDSTTAWLGDFQRGDLIMQSKVTPYYVRCVRGQLPAPNFVDNGNGTVTDNVTGLLWEKGFSSSTMSWDAALLKCGAHTLGGYNDWRLPNIRELFSIADRSGYNPAIDTTYFSYYGYANTNLWSSTTFAQLSTIAFVFEPYYGRNLTAQKTDATKTRVRCVRGGL